MADMTRIKKLLSQSTTMPHGTGIGKDPARADQPSTLLNMHTQRGGGCSCCSGGHHHDDDDEE